MHHPHYQSSSSYQVKFLWPPCTIFCWHCIVHDRLSKDSKFSQVYLFQGAAGYIYISLWRGLPWRKAVVTKQIDEKTIRHRIASMKQQKDEENTSQSITWIKQQKDEETTSQRITWVSSAYQIADVFSKKNAKTDVI